MKVDTHPTTHPVVFVDTSSGAEFVTTSILTSEEKRTIDGVEHYVINIEISSASHPFYTGKQIFVDTARRVEKFQEKMAKVKDAAGKRKGKKAKKAARAKDKEQDTKDKEQGAKSKEQKTDVAVETKPEAAPEKEVAADTAEASK